MCILRGWVRVLGSAVGATVVDYMPMLLVLHGHQQLHTAIENRFYLKGFGEGRRR